MSVRRKTPRGLPPPGLFSNHASMTAECAKTGSEIRPSSVLYSKERVKAVRTRSDGVGQRRMQKTAERKRLHAEQMVSKSTLADVSKMSRSRQGELAQELIAKQELLSKLEKEQKELDAMMQLSAVLLERRNHELVVEKEKMVENLQRIQSVISKQQNTIACAAEKKVRRNSITGSIKPQQRPSERRKSSSTPRGSMNQYPAGEPAPPALLETTSASATPLPIPKKRHSLLGKFGKTENTAQPLATPAQTQPPAPPSATSAETKRVGFANAGKGSAVSKLFGSGCADEDDWDTS